nr:hypothetical protein NG677_12095 [Methylobacterium sp. OTU13CASTA1]
MEQRLAELESGVEALGRNLISATTAIVAQAVIARAALKLLETHTGVSLADVQVLTISMCEAGGLGPEVGQLVQVLLRPEDLPTSLPALATG